MTLYEVLIGTVTAEEFVNAYEKAYSREKDATEIAKKNAILALDARLSSLLTKRMQIQRELARLQEIELWEPERLHKNDLIRMDCLRNHIITLKKREAETKARLSLLI